MSVLLFIALSLLLIGLSYVRAKRAGDRFNVAAFVPFAAFACTVLAVLRSEPSFSICLLFACVCTCAATDLSSGYVYDVVTYPSMAVLVIASLHEGTFTSTALWMSASFIGISLMSVMTRRRGIGFGDVKLFTVIGAALGASIAEVYGGSFVIGACCVIVGLLRKRLQFGERVAFAPYIAIATILTVPYEALLK